MKRIDSIQKNGMTNQSLTEILNDYDQMLTVFNKYNKVLKHILRKCAARYAFTILVTRVYISKVHTLIFQLHNKLYAFSAEHAINKPSRLSLKNIILNREDTQV